MAPANDDRDPVQKLKDLQDWLQNNKVSAKFPEKPPLQVSWAMPTDYRAAAEVDDFRNWVKEIQSPRFL